MSDEIRVLIIDPTNEELRILRRSTELTHELLVLDALRDEAPAAPATLPLLDVRALAWMPKPARRSKRGQRNANKRRKF